MHIRISRVTRKGKTYEYAQLVESYRRTDGMPATRVLANLGEPNSLITENMRKALEATKKRQRVAARKASRGSPALQPTANLRYLDVAVLLELWREFGLDDVLNDVLPSSQTTIPTASVITALTIQRCVDPGSKLYATQWLPRTALPLLLGFPVKSINNTRVHRALDDLDLVTQRLMARLVRQYQSREVVFGALFLDATDTWFVGHGPVLAERSKTKEGRVERKIGIVLLCNEHGYPLRWEVIRGRESEVVAMGRLVDRVSRLDWTQQVPLVCDRAMGRTAQIREMLTAGVHFVTALTRVEFDAYTSRIPHRAMEGFDPREDHREQDIAAAARLIEEAGLQRVEDHLYVMNLGTVTRVEEEAVEKPLTCAKNSTAKVMELARTIKDSVASGQYSSQASAGRALGIKSKALVSRYCNLCRLPETLQRQILDAKANGRSLEDLIRIARLPDEKQQCAAFAELISAPPPRRPSARPLGVTQPAALSTDEAAPLPVRVRAVLYFNPQLFVDQRLRAEKHIHDINAFVDDLNTRLASPRSRMQRDQIAATIDRRLRRDDLLTAFTPVITEHEIAGRRRFRVTLNLDKDDWARRRRFDGFSVIVAHPDIKHSASELCRLYRAKDAVEKDFQIIKSLIELRPIRHFTDAKVRAHVTICILALLLQRLLEGKLKGDFSPQSALERLATMHLNRYESTDGTVVHVPTRADTVQNKILRRLRLLHLTDFQETAQKTPPN